jgi:hypothetical protein
MADECSLINAYLVKGRMPQNTSTQPATYKKKKTLVPNYVQILKLKKYI